jgi:hypothetical protein
MTFYFYFFVEECRMKERENEKIPNGVICKEQKVATVKRTKKEGARQGCYGSPTMKENAYFSVRQCCSMMRAIV